MQLRNRYYSYPVIVEGGDSYPSSSFSSEVNQTMDGYNIKLTITVELKDDLLLEMVRRGDAVYAHHIECPQTCYRNVKKTKDNSLDYLLYDTDVNGLVQVCSFLVANKDIEKYTNPSFSPDYRGFKFNIEKGCILAVGNQYNIQVDKQRDDLVNTSSIFSIVKSMDPLHTTATVDIMQQKIIITLPEVTYNQYSSICDNAELQPVMHSMLIVPALVYIFSELRRAGSQLDEFEGYRWFRALTKACAAIEIPLDEERLKTMDIYKVSQLLLDSPVSKAMVYCAIGGPTYED